MWNVLHPQREPYNCAAMNKCRPIDKVAILYLKLASTAVDITLKSFVGNANGNANT